MKEDFTKLLSLRFKERNRSLLKNITDEKQIFNSRGLLNSSETVVAIHGVLENELKESIETIVKTIIDTFKKNQEFLSRTETEKICIEACQARVIEIEQLFSKNIEHIVSGLKNTAMIKPFLSLTSIKDLQKEEMLVILSSAYKDYTEKDSAVIAKPPAIINQIQWILLYGKRYWYLIILAALFSFSPLIYSKFNKSHDYKSHDIGELQLVFNNKSNSNVIIGNTGQFYITAPDTPGMNRRVSSGVIQLEDANEASLNIERMRKVEVAGKFLNERRLLQYIDAGEYFIEIIFPATPEPINTEIILTRDNILAGIEFKINGEQQQVQTQQEPSDENEFKTKEWHGKPLDTPL